ncbi:MAG: BtpA/SgcQ family protein [Gammaproteobacteria bacterium]|nr:BtpA/SgcQ family protein [Gammaproteobacteria bacterium]MDH5344453.1 BtpA/SgcQ family protein [Gammaproteobacteria bacterium]
MNRFRLRFGPSKVIIGMIHLPPLPGYPESPGIERVIRHAIGDLHTLESAGVDGVLVENEYDRPHRIRAEPETIAAMTRITRALVQESESALIGCEILLNDPKASLAVSEMARASFIRTDYFVDRMVRPEYGEFEIDPDGLIDYRITIGADDVLILADIQVKYATMVTPRSLAKSAKIAKDRGADAVIVTGSRSGDAPTPKALRDAAQGLPVLVGSGLTADNAVELLSACDGAIVGTSLMTNGCVDPEKIGRIMSLVRGE